MSKHEIRLRRQKMTSHGAERFRNYGAVLQRHEAEKRMKKVIRVFMYLLVIMILVILLVIVFRIERRLSSPTPNQRSSIAAPPPRVVSFRSLQDSVKFGENLT